MRTIHGVAFQQATGEIVHNDGLWREVVLGVARGRHIYAFYGFVRQGTAASRTEWPQIQESLRSITFAC